MGSEEATRKNGLRTGGFADKQRATQATQATHKVWTREYPLGYTQRVIASGQNPGRSERRGHFCFCQHQDPRPHFSEEFHIFRPHRAQKQPTCPVVAAFVAKLVTTGTRARKTDPRHPSYDQMPLIPRKTTKHPKLARLF